MKNPLEPGMNIHMPESFSEKNFIKGEAALDNNTGN